MTTYKHTQIAWTPLIIFVISFVYLSVSGKMYELSLLFHPLWIAIVLLLGVTSCLTLTIRVDDQHIKVAYGIGIIRAKFLFRNIDSIRAVRNPWWHGGGMNFLGIKSIPKGWLFSIWGRDAIELVMRNGKVYRIGTDEPQKLLEQIQSRLGK